MPLGERKRLLSSLPGWVINTEAEIDKLTKIYPTKNFSTAMQLAHAVEELAEAANHHPELLISWGSVRITWWTHSINGLHFNDFILAARCELVYQN